MALTYSEALGKERARARLECLDLRRVLRPAVTTIYDPCICVRVKTTTAVNTPR
jgi:hypothetical protein